MYFETINSFKSGAQLLLPEITRLKQEVEELKKEKRILSSMLVNLEKIKDDDTREVY